MRVFSTIANGFRADRAMILSVLLIWFVSVLTLLTKGVPALNPMPYFANTVIFASVMLFIIIPMGAHVLWRDRPDHPVIHLLRHAAQSGRGRQALRGLTLLAAIILLLAMFSVMKSSIELFNSYHWDPELIAADRAIHGQDAWRVIQPVLGYPIVTSALSVVYHLWLLLIYLGPIYFTLYCSDQSLRQRFLISYIGVWTIVGTLLAILFASVGPCFVGPMFGDTTFAPLMAYLEQANQHYPVLVLEVQHQLMQWQASSSHGLGRGLSAMPSVHVALAFLSFLAARHISRGLGIFFGVFFVLILLGSVHLGYHYAVDGYVSIAVMLVIWKLAGVWASRTASAAYPSPSTTSESLAAS